MTRRTRCEVTGCRGNAPCEACLIELSSAIRRGIESAWVKGLDKDTAAVLNSRVFTSVSKELNGMWAKSIAGKGGKK